MKKNFQSLLLTIVCGLFLPLLSMWTDNNDIIYIRQKSLPIIQRQSGKNKVSRTFRKIFRKLKPEIKPTRSEDSRLNPWINLS